MLPTLYANHLQDNAELLAPLESYSRPPRRPLDLCRSGPAAAAAAALDAREISDQRVRVDAQRQPVWTRSATQAGISAIAPREMRRLPGRLQATGAHQASEPCVDSDNRLPADLQERKPVVRSSAGPCPEPERPMQLRSRDVRWSSGQISELSAYVAVLQAYVTMLKPAIPCSKKTSPC